MPSEREAGARRLLNLAAVTLAAGVATDSAAEHYRAGFHNPAMFVGPVVSTALVAAAMTAATKPGAGRRAGSIIALASVAAGLIGCLFHACNTSRRIGGWSSTNLLHGAPLAAPLGLTVSGILAQAASAPVTIARARQLGCVTAAALAGTSLEAGILHFRGAFHSPFMYAPVILPPAAAAVLGAAVLHPSVSSRGAARALLHLTAWLGVAGFGFHVRGVQRRIGGWRNWRQNLQAGPPLPAPPAFTGLALAGLAALTLQVREEDQ